MSDKVSLTTDGGVAVVTLNAPEARNALTNETIDELADALTECRSGAVRAVVLTGSGTAFCSGADLREFYSWLELGEEEFSARVHAIADRIHTKVIERIRSLPKPVVASVNGVAAGAGAAIAVACDFRIASEEARFFLAFANIGATADSGSTYYLPRLVGQAKAMEIYLMKQPMSAQACLETGLFNRVCAPDKLGEHTMEIAHQLASGPTVAYGRVKALMDRSWTADFHVQLKEEAEMLGASGLTHDFQEGVRAFIEKRAPEYRGE